MRASTEHSTNTELPHYTAACLGPLQLILGLRKRPLLWIGLWFGLRFTLGLWLRAVQATNVLRRFLVGLDAQAQGVDKGNEPLVLGASCDGLLPAASFIYQVCKSSPAVSILTYYLIWSPTESHESAIQLPEPHGLQFILLHRDAGAVKLHVCNKGCAKLVRPWLMHYMYRVMRIIAVWSRV